MNIPPNNFLSELQHDLAETAKDLGSLQKHFAALDTVLNRTLHLELNEILEAFDIVETIYPRVLPITMWRAWEIAIYKHFELIEPVLDLACGDGGFFNLVWPNVKHVVGIDIDASVVERALACGVYTEVHNVPAHELPFDDDRFGSVFSNCALEHMDNIEGVLKETYRVLRPNGNFILSVVTDHFLDWSPLMFLTEVLGFPERWIALKDQYKQYHHLRNPFTMERWARLFEESGFSIEEKIPIAPDAFAHAFLLLDQLWHIPSQHTESGALMQPVLSGLPNYSDGMRDILSGLYKLSNHNDQGAGAVFALRKK